MQHSRQLSLHLKEEPVANSLREALESVAGLMASGKLTYLDEEYVRHMLAAHPAEPAAVVTDEAVAATRAWLDEYYDFALRGTDEAARLLLETAAPLLGLRPLLDREAVHQAIAANVWAVEGDGVEIIEAVPAVMELARPMPTQAELADWLRETFTADTIGPTWDLAAECLLIALNGAES